jgi:Ca2+-binding EF-hand superfamily protein
MFDIAGFCQFLQALSTVRTEFVELMSFAVGPEGLLTADSLGDFIESRIPKVCPKVSQLKPSGEEFYRQFVLEHFLFHFDPLSFNRISAVDLIVSPEFVHFLELTPESDYENPYSWSSFASAFSAFRNCTNDEGLVSKAGFKNSRDCKFCDAFVDRVFEVSSLFGGLMDFGGFCKFMVYKDNCETATGARFFFKLFDLDGDGKLSPLDVAYFFRSLAAESDRASVSFDNFMYEMLDKTQATGMEILLDQFVSCGACEEIALTLSDVSEFDMAVGHDGPSELL